MLNGKKLVVLDPAHGGSDLGAVVGVHKESIIVRSIVRRLQDKLLAERKLEAKTSFELAGRVPNSEWPHSLRMRELNELSKSTPIDFFLRIGLNYSTSEVQGGLVIGYSGSLCTPVMMYDALVFHAQAGGYSLAGNKTRFEYHFRQISPVLSMLSREVLVEPGFLSNPTDCKMLASVEGQEMLAAGLALGIYRVLER